MTAHISCKSLIRVDRIFSPVNAFPVLEGGCESGPTVGWGPDTATGFCQDNFRSYLVFLVLADETCRRSDSVSEVALLSF